MPAPSSVLSTLRPDLAASFTQYDLAASAKGFIATRVLTPVDVPVQAGNFGLIPIEQLLQKRNTERAPGGGYNRSNWNFSPGKFSTKENGLEEPIDDREAKMYANYFSAEQVGAMRARDGVMRNMETRVVGLLTDTTNTFLSGSNLSGPVATSWKTAATATGTADSVKARTAIYNNCGLIANCCVIGWNAWQNLTQQADILSRIKFSGIDDPKDITNQMIASLFQVDQVIVAGAQNNTANEGQKVSLSGIWSDDKVGFYVTSDSEDFKDPCVGRVFHWAEDGSAIGGVVESYRDETVRSNIIRVRMDSDEQILYAQAGYVLTGANS